MKKIFISLALVVWIIVAFILAGIVTDLVFQGVAKIGISISTLMGETALNMTLAALNYGLALGLTIGVPWMLFRRRTSRTELGLQRLIAGKDVLLVIPASIAYILLSMVVIGILTQVPGFNVDQTQDIGFSNLFSRSDFIFAFISLVVLAPLAEEILFRGYLYGKVRKRLPFIVTLVLVSLTFAALHLPGLDAAGHLQLQWNVVADVFCLSVVMCAMREYTKSVWTGVLIHMVKNGIAFYILFIVPLLHTMGA